MSLTKARNTEVNRTLCNLMAAVHHLDALGCEVVGIELGGRNPLIAIHQPTSEFLQGAVVGRQVRGDLVRVVMGARVHDCQVHWQETYARPREVANG